MIEHPQFIYLIVEFKCNQHDQQMIANRPIYFVYALKQFCPIFRRRNREKFDKRSFVIYTQTLSAYTNLTKPIMVN